MDILKQYKGILKEYLLSEVMIDNAFNSANEFYKACVNDPKKFKRYIKENKIENIRNVYEEIAKHNDVIKEHLSDFMLSGLNEEKQYYIDVMAYSGYKKAVNNLISGKKLNYDYFMYLVELDYIYIYITNKAYKDLETLLDNSISLEEDKIINNYVNSLYNNIIKRFINLKLYQEDNKYYRYPKEISLYSDELLDQYIKEGKLNSYDILILSNVIETFNSNNKDFDYRKLYLLLNGNNDKPYRTGVSGIQLEKTKEGLNKLQDIGLIRFTSKWNNKNSMQLMAINVKPEHIYKIKRSYIVTPGYTKKIITIYFISKCESFKNRLAEGKKQKDLIEFIDLEDIKIMLDHKEEQIKADRQIIENLIKEYSSKYGFDSNLDNIIKLKRGSKKIIGYKLKIK